MKLSFGKIGYYGVDNLCFPSREHYPLIKNNKLTIKGVKVVLLEIGHLQALNYRKSYLKVFEGKGIVMDLRHAQSGKWQEDGDWYERKVSDIRQTNSLPKQWFYLFPTMDSKGKVILTKKLYKTKEDLKTVCESEELDGCSPEELKDFLENANENSRSYPKSVELKISDPDSGFVRMHPKSWKFELSGNGDMRLAPKEGYEKTLKLDFTLKDSMGETFFYFKIKGNYGKGRVSWLEYDSSAQCISVELECYINRTSSRNLESD